MSTEYISLSSQEYPEHIYMDGTCYRLLDESRRTNAGLVIDSSRLETYDSCESCNAAHPQNTLYVTYE